MVWIKRNLYFVLSAAVGVILMGVAGYFLYSGMNENASSSEALKQAIADLENYQSKAPYPSDENIAEAKKQQQEVKNFLEEIRKSFAPIPIPEKTDEKGFKTLLDKSIAQLQGKAASSGVGLPLQYAFSFSAITTKLTFPVQNIEPWTVQLQEIKSLCGVLFQARINYLEGIRRVPIGGDEQGGPDYLAAASVTNETCVRTPYEITFRAFSGEIAAVLDGLERSTNCFSVKNIDIQGARPGMPIQTGIPDQRGNPEMRGPDRRGQQPGRPGRFGPNQPFAPGAYGGPITILSEVPLRVTILVEVIKLKSP
jgi:hypothetical protein